MKLRLLVAAVVLLAAAPAAQANDPPYPACSPAKPFTWHAGSRIFATSAYVVLLNADAREVWGAGRRRRDVAARPGPARPTRYVDAVPPGRGRERLAVGFRSVHAGSPCLALEQRHFTVKQPVRLGRLRAVAHGGVLRVFGFRAGRGCHSLGGGAFHWHFEAGGKNRTIGSADACGPLDGAGVPTAGRGCGRRSSPSSPARRRAGMRRSSYLEVRAAHPRRSGKVRFNLDADLARTWRRRTGSGVVIGVTVTVDYRPGARPQWRTVVRVRTGVRSRIGGGSGGSGGGVSLPGGGSGDSPGDPACSGLSC